MQCKQVPSHPPPHDVKELPDDEVPACTDNTNECRVVGHARKGPVVELELHLHTIHVGGGTESISLMQQVKYTVCSVYVETSSLHTVVPILEIVLFREHRN